MKFLVLILLGLLTAAQAALWTRPNGMQDLMRLNVDISAARVEIADLSTKNKFLAAEVLDLRTGTDALEERARSDLGMIRASETFFQVIESPAGVATSVETGAETRLDAGTRAVDLTVPANSNSPRFDQVDSE